MHKKFGGIAANTAVTVVRRSRPPPLSLALCSSRARARKSHFTEKRENARSTCECESRIKPLRRASPAPQNRRIPSSKPHGTQHATSFPPFARLPLRHRRSKDTLALESRRAKRMIRTRAKRDPGGSKRGVDLRSSATQALTTTSQTTQDSLCPAACGNLLHTHTHWLSRGPSCPLPRPTPPSFRTPAKGCLASWPCPSRGATDGYSGAPRPARSSRATGTCSAPRRCARPAAHDGA